MCVRPPRRRSSTAQRSSKTATSATPCSSATLTASSSSSSRRPTGRSCHPSREPLVRQIVNHGSAQVGAGGELIKHGAHLGELGLPRDVGLDATGGDQVHQLPHVLNGPDMREL